MKHSVKALAVAVTSALALLPAAPSLGAPAPEPIAVDLTSPQDQINTVRSGSALTIVKSPKRIVTDRANAPAEAYYTAPALSLGRRVAGVRLDVTADVPSGGEVRADVRGRDGGAWTEWSGGQLARPSSDVQVRLTLVAAPGGRAPKVTRVRLTPDSKPLPETGPLRSRERTMAAPLVSRVFATREGLVGGTTANGHVIKPRDHFVALPSRRALASNGGREYTVRVCYPKNGRCETAPVWDVGPWNTKDDYWNPSSIREMWKDLPQGRPEAQAAFQNGYNGGKDQFGRRVSNPAGIDLADGTFWDGLGMSDNDWVDVTYEWTDTGCGVRADGKLYCTNGPSPMYAQANFGAAVVDQLRTTSSWFTCWTTGAPHGGGNSTWYYTQGDDHGRWGFVPAQKLNTSSQFDADPSAHGLRHC